MPTVHQRLWPNSAHFTYTYVCACANVMAHACLHRIYRPSLLAFSTRMPSNPSSLATYSFPSCLATFIPNISASSMWWVQSTMVLFCLLFSRKSQICRRANGSTPDVGSSRMMVRHLPTNASKMDNFRFIPPDRCLASLLPWPLNSTLSSHLCRNMWQWG